MKSRVSDVFVSVCIFVAGIFLLLWADKVTNLVSQILGTVSIIYGAYQLVLYFKSTDKKAVSLIYSIIFLVIGIILVARPTIVSEIISFTHQKT